MFGNALIIGGTGMLDQTTKFLTQNANKVFVLSRHAEDYVRRDNISNLNALVCDYSDAKQLDKILRASCEAHGAVDLAVCWIHSCASDARRVVARALSSHGRYIEVSGSASSRVNKTDQSFLGSEQKYQNVCLGFVADEGGSRWLTNDEISDGVVEAILSGARSHVVGQLEPWDMRP